MSDEKPNIWRLQTKFDTQGLIKALEYEDAGIRRRAAAAIRALGVVEAIPVLRVMLVNERDPDVKATASAALEALLAERQRFFEQEAEALETPKPPKTPEQDPSESSRVDFFILHLNDKNPQDIIKAVQTLGELKDKRAVEPLVGLFQNPSTSIKVRLAVAEALLKLESAPVEVTLLAALRHKHWHIRRNGAAILGQLNADWAVEPLARAMGDENMAVRKMAYAALKRIGTPEARAAAKAALRTVKKPSPKKKSAVKQEDAPSTKLPVSETPPSDPVSPETVQDEVGAQAETVQEDPTPKDAVPTAVTHEKAATDSLELLDTVPEETAKIPSVGDIATPVKLNWPDPGEIKSRRHTAQTRPLDSARVEEAEERRKDDKPDDADSDDESQ